MHTRYEESPLVSPHLLLVGLRPRANGQLGDLNLGVGDVGDLAVHHISFLHTKNVN